MESTQNTKKRDRILLLTTVLLLFIVGGYMMFLFASSKKNQSTTSPVPSEKKTQAAPKEVKVTLTEKGFEPQRVTISVGSAVHWINESGETATVNSDDHPTHQKSRELNLGEFMNGSSLVLIMNKKGTYTYHDHFNPSKKGTIIVQ